MIDPKEQERYNKLPFKTVYKNWSTDKQGNIEDRTDIFFLGWLKVNDPIVYKKKKERFDEFKKGQMDAKTYDNLIIEILRQSGLVKRRSSRHKPKEKEHIGCTPCYIPGRVSRCNSGNSRINDRGGV